MCVYNVSHVHRRANRRESWYVIIHSSYNLSNYMHESLTLSMQSKLIKWTNKKADTLSFAKL